MVAERKRARATFVGICSAMVFLGGCAGAPTPAPSRAIATAGDLGSTVPTVMPSGPIGCGPITGFSDVEQLVWGGQTVAVVSVDVKATAGPLDNYARMVPVASADLVAGSLSNGPLKQIEESEASEATNTLEPGQYTVMLGIGSNDGTYFLSNGVRGSFVHSGNDAYRRCPNPDGTGDTVVLDQGVTDLATLAPLFEKAIQEQSDQTSP